jgi:hypothetical protein
VEERSREWDDLSGLGRSLYERQANLYFSSFAFIDSEKNTGFIAAPEMSDPWNAAPRPNKRSRPGEGEEEGQDDDARARTQLYGVPPHGMPPHAGPPPQAPPHYYYAGPPPPGYPSQQPVPPPHHPPPPYMYHPHPVHYPGYPPPEYAQPRPQDPYYLPARPEYAGVARAAAGSSSSVGSIGGDSGNYDVLSKRAKKNSQSRARAAKLRQRVEELKYKPSHLRDEEERKLFSQFEDRRSKKNERSRERAIEKKGDVERILAIPEHERSREDQIALDTAIKAKLRKNEGDRLRRERIKRMGMKAGNQPRSRGRPKKQAGSQKDDATRPPTSIRTGTEHPISPIAPSMPSQDLGMPSPGFLMSPGLGFPSPHAGAPSAAAPMGMGGESYTGAQVPVPLLPRDEAGDGRSQGQHSGDPATWPHLHLPQRSTNVQQHRNPDGSMSINIFGRGDEAGGAASEGARPHQGEGPPPFPPPDV